MAYEIAAAVGGAAIGGGLGFLGSAYGQRQAARQAKKNRKFQERMYKHRYQYTVTDLKKAGINPILAAQGGLGGGSSPSGSMATTPDYGSSVSKGGATGLQVMLAKAQLDNIREQTRKTGAEADVIGPRAEVYKEGLNMLRPLIASAKEWLGEVEMPSTAQEVLSDATRRHLQRSIDEDDVRKARMGRRGRVINISHKRSKRPRKKIEKLMTRERRYRNRRYRR